MKLYEKRKRKEKYNNENSGCLSQQKMTKIYRKNKKSASFLIKIGWWWGYEFKIIKFSD